MNMFYTGLGIARSLGRKGIPVIGLTTQRRIYGNFTRYAKTRLCPDSKSEPEALLPYLVDLGRSLDHRAIIFPTRDDDLVFLNRYRAELTPYFRIVSPEPAVLENSLNKWRTYLCAQRAGVAVPKSWLIENESDLNRVLDELRYPCVLKPLSAHQWRTKRNWALVGHRKAIPVSTREQLLSEFATVSAAGSPLLVQEVITGADDRLVTTACYLDASSNLVATFNTRKLAQSPPGFGTGVVVQAANYPELLEPTVRLLREMRFTGIAEVEYKWDAAGNVYRLIEVNPRPWDQHALGNCCGVDLIYLAYCEHAGLPLPDLEWRTSDHKWIADDVFWYDVLWYAARFDCKCWSLLRLIKGRRVHAIWSTHDPLPFLADLALSLIPLLAFSGLGFLRAALRNVLRLRRPAAHAAGIHDGH